jgi:hypothetical protein
MHIQYDEMSYYLPCTPEELRDKYKGVIRLPAGKKIQVKAWFPKPLTPMSFKEPTDTPQEIILAETALFVRKVTITKPQLFTALHLYFRTHTTMPIRVELDMRWDVCCHTEEGMCQDILSTIVADADHWGKFKVDSWYLCGFKAPYKVVVAAELRMRTKFAPKRRKQKTAQIDMAAAVARREAAENE